MRGVSNSEDTVYFFWLLTPDLFFVKETFDGVRSFKHIEFKSLLLLQLSVAYTHLVVSDKLSNRKGGLKNGESKKILP